LTEKKNTNNNMAGRNGHECLVITDPKFLDFISIQEPKTAKTYKVTFRKLMAFDSTINGQEMLNNKKLWEMQTIFEFQKYLAKSGLSQSSIKSTIGGIRGFFSANREALNFTPQEKRKINVCGRSTEDYLFTKQELYKLWNLADLSEKWILCNKSLGMRIEDFARITWGHLRTINLEEDPAYFGDYLTAKENVVAHPFLDSDAIIVVRQLLDLNKDKTDNDRVFNKSNTQASYILQKLVKDSGIVTANKVVRFHNLRKYCNNALMSVMATTKANQILGHSNGASSEAYLHPEVRECFSRAEPSLILNGNGGLKVIKNELAQTNSTVETLVKLLSAKDEQIKELKLMIESQTKISQEFRSDLIDFRAELARTQKELKVKPKPFVYGTRHTTDQDNP
jgi:integrase